ncbi:hypothetical protein ACSBSA_07600 [Streptococcus suis]
MRKPKITVIGGGTGIPVILKSWNVNRSHRDKDRRKETVNRS